MITEVASRVGIMNQALIELKDTGPTLPSQAGDVEIPHAIDPTLWIGWRGGAPGLGAAAGARGRICTARPGDRREIGRILLKSGLVSPIFVAERPPFRRLRANATVNS